MSWKHLKWILHKLVGGLVQDWEQCPVDIDREVKLVLEIELT